MATLTNSRIAFIHVPKTGGTWANVAMRQAGIEFDAVQDNSAERRGHYLWNEVPETLFRFGFVRHPIGWYRSWWTHRTTHQDWGSEILDDIGRVPFPDFLEAVAEQAPGYLSHLYEVFLGRPDDIEFVGRYENLQEDLITALELAGESFDAEAIRATPAANVGVDLPETTGAVDRVIEAEQPLMERYYHDMEVGR